jgi:hypothetical protein
MTRALTVAVALVALSGPAMGDEVGRQQGLEEALKCVKDSDSRIDQTGKEPPADSLVAGSGKDDG